MPQVSPRPIFMQGDLRNPTMYSTYRAWQPAFQRTVAEQIALYQQPAFRDAFVEDIAIRKRPHLWEQTRNLFGLRSLGKGAKAPRHNSVTRLTGRSSAALPLVRRSALRFIAWLSNQSKYKGDDTGGDALGSDRAIEVGHQHVHPAYDLGHLATPGLCNTSLLLFHKTTIF